jgi:hypothetical protein
MCRELIGDEDAPFLVGFDRVGVGVERRRQILVLCAQAAVVLERRGEGVEFARRPRFDARVQVGRPQHELDSGSVAITGLAQGGAELRRHRHAALGVELVLVTAEELVHAPARLPRMGKRGISRHFMGRQRESYGFACL